MSLAAARSILRGELSDDLVATVESPAFAKLLQAQGIAILARRLLQDDERLAARLPLLMDALADVAREATMRLLLQERAVASFVELVEAPFVVWRGLHLGAFLYDDPSERIGSDVDLLVAESDRERVVRALIGAGYAPEPRRATASHELVLAGHGVYVDLHWHVVRPGRSGFDLAGWVLEHRETRGGVPVPSSTASAVVLLVHTALTEHVTGRLIRAMDVARLVQRDDVDWREVVATLDTAGLKTAAWTTLKWTERVLDCEVPPALEQALRPSAVRRRYLLRWLAADPARLYGTSPLAVRAGFSLALQDDIAGVGRALVGLARSRLRSPRI